MPDTPDTDFQSAFWSAKRAIAEAAEEAYGRHGVRAGQQFILQRLWAEDCLSPGEIARHFRLATPTVTKAANRMAAAGLIERRPHPTDARSVRLCLTRKGKSLRRAIDAEILELTERALATLDAESRASLVSMLREVSANLARP